MCVCVCVCDQDKSAYALTIFAFAKDKTSEPILFSGRTEGNIVPARGLFFPLFSQVAMLTVHAPISSNSLFYSLFFFTGAISGPLDFGWDPIFEPLPTGIRFSLNTSYMYT